METYVLFLDSDGNNAYIHKMRMCVCKYIMDIHIVGVYASPKVGAMYNMHRHVMYTYSYKHYLYDSV